jgi:hypothetical protein
MWIKTGQFSHLPRKKKNAVKMNICSKKKKKGLVRKEKAKTTREKSLNGEMLNK